MFLCSQGYYRAAKASAGKKNILAAVKYLEEGIINCKETKDLVEYLNKLKNMGKYIQSNQLTLLFVLSSGLQSCLSLSFPQDLPP